MLNLCESIAFDSCEREEEEKEEVDRFIAHARNLWNKLFSRGRVRNESLVAKKRIAIDR